MSISESNMTEECRNGVFLLQSNTSVDTLLGKWLKEDVKVESKSCSDEMMDVEMSATIDYEKDTDLSMNSSPEHETLPQEDPEVSVLDIWTQCVAFYEIFKLAPGSERILKAQEKEPQFKARKRFENWFDIFLVRGLTMREEDWNVLMMKKSSENGMLMSDVMSNNLVEYLMDEVRNICLHFEAYKDFEPLRNYLFGKGWRILKLLCRIQSFITDEKNNSKTNLFSSTSKNGALKSESVMNEKDKDDEKEFVDLLLHLFQLVFYNQSIGSGTNLSSKNTSTSWSTLSHWKETNTRTSPTQTPANESNLQEFKYDMINVGKKTDLSVRESCVSIKDISALWNELENFSSSNSNRSKLSPVKSNSKSSNGRLSDRKRVKKKSDKYNHKERRIRHVLDGFPDPPSPGTALQKVGDRQYRFGTAGLSTDSDDILNQTNSFLIQSSTTKNICVKMFQSNPMDFEYFDKVVRSEDEAKQQLEWKRSKKMIQHTGKGYKGKKYKENASADFQKVYDHELCPEKCKSSFHDEFITHTVSEYHLSSTILSLLQAMYTKSMKHQLSNVFLASTTKNRMYDFLTQFCADNLMLLSQNKQNECFSENEKHEIQILLMKLIMTCLLKVVFDPDYIIHLQNNNIIHLSLSTLEDILKWAESQVQKPLKSCDLNIIIQKVVDLNSLFMKVIKSFHVVGVKMHKRPGVKISYMVCDWFCMENGAGVIGECLSLISKQAHKHPGSMSRNTISSVTTLIKEIGKFLSATGVCESLLVQTQCTKRTITVLTTMYRSLLKYLCDFANVEVTQVVEGNIVSALLDGLLLNLDTDQKASKACLNPHVIWEDILSLILMYNCKPEGESVQNKAYFLLETYILHYISRHSDELIQHTNTNNPSSAGNYGSLTDSDSAFYDPTTYASDTSLEDRTISVQQEVRGNECSYLEKYRMGLLTTNEKVARKTIQHIDNFVYICPLKLRIQILKVVLIPTLQDLSDVLLPLTEIQTYLGRRLLNMIEKLVKEEETLGHFCAQRKLFKTILKFSCIEGDQNNYFFADDAFDCAQSFVGTEVKRCLKAVSMDSLPSPAHASSSEFSRESDIGSPFDFEQNGHFFSSLSSNDVINEVLIALVSETNNMVLNKSFQSITSLHVKVVGAMWKMQAGLLSQIPEYASFFLQTPIHVKLSHAMLQYLLKVLAEKSLDEGKDDFNKSVIVILGWLLQLLSHLSTVSDKRRPDVIGSSNLTLKAALDSIEEYLIPNNGVTTNFNETDVKAIISVLIKSAIQSVIPVEDLSSDDNQSNNIQYSFANSSNPSTSFSETNSGYVPDSDDDKSDLDNLTVSKNSISETYSKTSIIKKKVTNKDILDFVVHVLVDIEHSEQNPLSVEGDTAILIDGISRLLDLAKGDENRENRDIMNELDVSKRILNSLASLFKDEHVVPKSETEINGNTLVLRKVLMELVVQLNKEELSGTNFGALMSYFKKDSKIPSSCVRILLESLNRIVYQTSSTTLEPSSYLEFKHMKESTAVIESGVLDKDTVVSDNGADGTVNEHICEDFCFVSAWKTSALAFNLPYSTAEPMFSMQTKTDVTISTWLYWDFYTPATHCNSTSPVTTSNLNEISKFHIVSVGSKSLLLECWMDASTIQVRVTSSTTANQQKLAGKATFHLIDFFPTLKTSNVKPQELKQWTHLVITCATKNDKSAVIQIFVNTSPSKTLLINLKSIYSQLHQNKRMGPDSTRQALLIGHQAEVPCKPEEANSHYRIGASCFVFHSVIREPITVAALYFLGPNLESFTECLITLPSQTLSTLMVRGFKDCQKYAHLFLLLSQDINSSSDDAQTYKNAIKSLKHELRVQFCVRNPTQAFLYPPNTKDESGGSILSSLYNSLSGPSSMNNQELETIPCQEQPIVICNSLTSLNVNLSTAKRFESVMLQEGGTPLLLLLIARVVELTSSTKQDEWNAIENGNGDLEIALALDILLKVIGSSSEANQDFHSRNGFLLLKTIFATEKCNAGTHTIKVMFKHCISPHQEFGCQKNMADMHKITKAFFYDLDILNLILFDCWKVWTKEEVSHAPTLPNSVEPMKLVLQVCASLLQESNTHRRLNVNTLKCLDLTKRFAYLISSDGKRLNKNIASLISEIMCQFVESPPSVKDVKTLVETVLLLHESNLTYVAHAKNNFFFMICERSKIRRRTSETQQYEQRQQLPLVNASPSSLTKKSTPEHEEVPSMIRNTKVNQTENVCFGVLKNNEIPDDRRRIAKGNIPEEDYFSPDQEMANILESRLEEERIDSSKSAPSEDTRRESSVEEDDSTATGSVVSEMDVDIDCYLHQHLLEHPGKWGISSDKDNNETDGHLDPNIIKQADTAGMDCVIEGVMRYLVNTLQNLPDDIVKDIVTQAIKPEFILVIANHPNSQIRNISVSLLRQYIQRTHGSLEAHGYRLLKLEGYLLLANQLHQYNATENLINTCLGIVHGRPMSLYECPEIPSNFQITIRTPGLVPLLALMPKTLGDVALAHSLIVHIHELCAKVPGLLRNHTSIGLFETLCKTLAALAHLSKQRTDVCGQDSREILFSDLYDFFRLIGLRFVTAHGSENWSTVEEFLKLLLFMSIEDTCTEGTGAFRSAVCILLEECLSDVQHRVAQIDMYSKKRNGGGGIGSNTLLSLGTFGNIYGTGNHGNAMLPVEEVVTDIFMRAPLTPRDSFSEPGNGSPRQRRRHQTGEIDDISLSTTKTGYLNGGSSWTTKNPDNVKLATRPELVERFGLLIDFAVDFLLHIDASNSRFSGPTQLEEEFIFTIMALLLDEVKIVLKVSTEAEPSNTNKLKCLYSNKLELKLKVLSLINFCLSAAMPHNIRQRMIRTLYYEPETEVIIKYLLNNNASHGYLFSSFVGELVRLNSVSQELPDLEQNETVDFYTKLKECSILEDNSDMDESGTGKSLDRKTVTEKFLKRLRSSRRNYNNQCVNQVLKTTQEQYDDLILVVTSKALEVTQVAMKAQDEERKKMMATIKNDLSENVKATQLWHGVIEQYTHERALWHTPSTSPKSWKLSEAEGAHRMRIRLNRSFTDTQSKHYKDEHKLKGEDTRGDPPFRYLLATLSGMSSVIIAQLSSKDRIRHMEQCLLVLPAAEISGEILISDGTIYFVESSRDVHQTLTESLISFSIDIENILEAHNRWYQLTDCALEIFLEGGITKMFAFIDHRQRDEFTINFSKLGSSSPTKLTPLEKITKRWQEGDLTNFDYLMQLNKHAGRTFNDLMQYPTFPFVLAEYEALKLDLRIPNVFRDLSKPISIQDPSKEIQYKETYSALENELAQSLKTTYGPGIGPFHYGSHYSNSGIVLHFLARLPPFTDMFLSYQDGNFDLPDRMFHNMGTSWYLASRGSSTDFKELIPELYYLPELFINDEGLQLGTRQNGDAVDNVLLPLYCERDARLFVKLHRQALESDYVRENLNQWIDLIFGYKQKGKEALEAINVFHPATYYGFDLNSIMDPVQREARATMIKMYGQTPKQLFTKPHPKASRLPRHPRQFPRHPRHPFSSEELSLPPFLIPKVLDNVDGVNWGSYVGSPALQDPIIVWNGKQSGPFSKLIPAGKNELYCVPKFSMARISHFDDKFDLSGQNQLRVPRQLILNWEQPDGIIRLKSDGTLEPFIKYNKTITCVEIGAKYIYIGFDTGRITSVRYEKLRKDYNIKSSTLAIDLFAHTDSILSIATCSEFSLMVSASSDNTCSIWDTTKCPTFPTYIRTIVLTGPVYLVEISKTSGDIATVNAPPDENEISTFQGVKSVLSLYGINGKKVAERTCEPQITALVFSTAPEGTSVNVVATGHGLQTGVIRLWSTWDLSPVRDISTSQNSTIVSIAFSLDNLILYVATEDNEIIIFESAKENSSATTKKYTPKICMLSSA